MSANTPLPVPLPAAPLPVDRSISRTPLPIRLLRNSLARWPIVYLVLLILVAIIGPFLVPHDPNATSIDNVFAPPGGRWLLGTDSAGRDILSRLIVATSVSLGGASVTVVVAVLIGVPAGLIAGYRGGWFDRVANWFASLLLALPGIVALLAVRAVVGPSIWIVMAIFGVLISPAFYRIVSNSVRAVREELYIDAAKVSGISDTRIVFRHVLSAVRAPAILMGSGVFAVGVAIQATVDFLGLGDPGVPTWGAMLSEGFYNISQAPLLILWPTLAIGLTCLAFTLFGAGLRDELELAGESSRKPLAAWSRSESQAPAAVMHSEAPRDALLNVSGLSVAYPARDHWSTVVRDLDLTIGRSEIHALIGESGSGKTQTGWSILGLLPTGGTIVGGSIRFAGTELVGAEHAVLRALRGRRIGYVPQEPMSNLDPSSTIGHQLTEPLRVVLGLTRAEAKSRALALLDQVGIVDPVRTFRSYPHELSGGMAQRVLIAAALSCEPELIIADEPTTALDVTVQAGVLGLLRRLRDETGVAILLVTHNFGVVADLADRVSVMRAGTIVETGSVSEVFASPVHEYTKALFASLLTNTPPRAAPNQEPEA
jgi:peptide/nickel transport system permease protein